MQRALFARLLLQDARVIVLDEPFNAVDAKTVSDLVALVQRAGTARNAPVIAALCTISIWFAQHSPTCCYWRASL